MIRKLLFIGWTVFVLGITTTLFLSRGDVNGLVFALPVNSLLYILPAYLIYRSSKQKAHDARPDV